LFWSPSQATLRCDHQPWAAASQEQSLAALRVNLCRGQMSVEQALDLLIYNAGFFGARLS